MNSWNVEEVQNKIIDYFVDAYQVIEEESARFKDELGRFNYVTPTLYLNCLK